VGADRRNKLSAGELLLGIGTILGGLIDWLSRDNKTKTLLDETERTDIASIRVLEKSGFVICKQVDNLLFSLNLTP